MRNISGISKAFLLSLLTFIVTAALGVSSVRAQVDFAPAEGSEPAAPRTQAAPAVSDASATSSLSNSFDSFSAPKVYRGEKISLDFQNADIHNILRLIGEVSGKNVVVSDQVSGKVTLKLKNVPWDQALDIVLASKNLGVMENGNVLRIDSLEAIRRATPDLSDPNARVVLKKKVFTPKYSAVSTLAMELEKGKSVRGSVKVIGNDIFVEDDPKTIDSLTEIFMRNDQVTKQILIEARIVEADNNFTQQIGVRWGNRYDNKGGGASWNIDGDGIVPNSREGEFVPSEFFGAIDVSGANGASLGFGFLNRAGTILLNAELNASELVDQTKTISAPRIMASNDQEVYIKQGKQIPYKSGSSATTASNTEFKDAVMELRVTPHIEENGQIVTLDITLTKDTVGASFGGEPSIDTKEARTKLMVRDGETVVIGGIVLDTEFNSAGRVPGFHRIPLFGWLFKEKQFMNNKSELLIFITANIIPINI